MSWKWNGEGRRNRNIAAIRAGVKRAVWRCKACGKGQMGGRHVLETGGAPLHVRRCRYCRHEEA